MSLTSTASSVSPLVAGLTIATQLTTLHSQIHI